MATVLTPCDGREVVRCDVCSLVQFRTCSGFCRRCRSAYDPQPVIEVQAQTEERPQRRCREDAGDLLPIGRIARALREAQGMSQRDLALRMHVPRTYISKVECARCTPTLDVIERLAVELNVGAANMVAMVELAGRANA